MGSLMTKGQGPWFPSQLKDITTSSTVPSSMRLGLVVTPKPDILLPVDL